MGSLQYASITRPYIAFSVKFTRQGRVAVYGCSKRGSLVCRKQDLALSCWKEERLTESLKSRKFPSTCPLSKVESSIQSMVEKDKGSGVGISVLST